MLNLHLENLVKRERKHGYGKNKQKIYIGKNVIVDFTSAAINLDSEVGLHIPEFSRD